MNMTTLNGKNLASLPRDIKIPNYDRSALTPGIVHIGVGNFHRAHQAWYLHQLMRQGLALNWAIIGAGVRPYDKEMCAKLADQDYLTTLIELTPQGCSVEVVGSMIGYVPVEDGHGALIKQMADPSIRIVSLTVTEGGYYIDPVTGDCDVNHPELQHDTAHPERPKTAFGAIIAALKMRREAGLKPFSCLSCDNLQGNGEILRQTIVSLACQSDKSLAGWIEEYGAFPNSMVDCIVPATGEKELELVLALGVEDAVPVTHENFRQWVIEDAFCAGRPDWDKAGATFSDNVHQYELQKIRILNAGHQIIANAAEVLGIETVSEVMKHDTLYAMFRKITLEEIAPLVGSVPGMTPEQYINLIDQRFSNPSIVDTVRRIGFDGSSRHPGFVLPTVRDAIKAAKSFEGLALVQAAWARMCVGVREDGSKIEPNDPFWDLLTNRAGKARHTPLRWLEMHQFYGDLADHSRFATAFGKWLEIIYRDGMEAAIQKYLKGN